jgi:hypothetical protein
MNVPLALPDATPDKLTSTYRPYTFQGMTPKPGGTSSSIKVWGSEDTAKYVEVSSVSDLLKSFVANNGSRLDGSLEAAPAVSSSSAVPQASSSAAVQAAKPTNDATDTAAGAAVSPGDASSTIASAGLPTVTVTHSAPAATITVTDHTCRR